MRAFLLLVFTSANATSQTTLQEDLSPGTTIRFKLSMHLSGQMKFERNGRVESVPLEASGQHNYLERSDSEHRSLRYYFEAESTTANGFERDVRKLPRNHRFIVAERSKKSVTPISLAGPLTVDELSLVAEHFDAWTVVRLLPGKDVLLGDTWPISDDVACQLCLFDGVLKQTLSGRLVDVRENVAKFTVEGDAEGVERGAKVRLKIKASGEFHRERKRIETFTWEQEDVREQGPVSPALEAKVTVKVIRALEATSAQELNAPVPVSNKIPKEWLQLQYRHPGKAFEVLHNRNWHAVVQTESHLVLRLMKNGEIISQATITPWKKAEKNTATADANRQFVEATTKQPGWKPDRILHSDALPGNPQIFHHQAEGKQDNYDVVQSFFLIRAADGRQAVVTIVTDRKLFDKLGTSDIDLVHGVRFPAME